MNPELLLHPNIPKPLHGVAPRVLAGQRWWDQERLKAYAAADFKCDACGTSKEDAEYHQWLEAHEVYDYDYKKGQLTFVRLVALCHACHNFIHCGRMAMLVDQDKMTVERYKAIMARGMQLLENAGLLAAWHTRHDASCSVPWVDWRLVFDGEEYGPSSASYEDWATGAWREWHPPQKLRGCWEGNA